MKFFLGLLLISFTCLIDAQGKTLLKAEDIIYNPGGNSPGVFVTSYKDYEDIRVDSDLDGKIDFWKVKKGSLQIEILFSSGLIKHYFVRKIGSSTVNEFYYSSVDGKLLLQQARTRSTFDRGYSPADICDTNLQKMEKELQTFKADIESEIASQAAETDLLDRSCKEKLTPREFIKLKSTIASTTTTQDFLGSCFSSESFEKKFDFGKDTALTKKVLSTAYELQKRQLIYQSGNHKSVIKCDVTDKDPFSPASTDEKGTITFLKSAKPDGKLSDNIKLELQHELLHRLGFFSEKTVNEIIKGCKELQVGEFKKVALASSKMNGILVLPGNVSAALTEATKDQTANIPEKQATTPKGGATTFSGNVKDGIELAANTSTANIPAEIPASQLAAPSSQSLSEVVNNPPPQTDSGSQQALTRSASDSSGILRAANNMIGSMSSPAVAQESSRSSAKSKVADATDVASSSSSLTESTSSSSGNRVPASVSLGVQARNKISSDEKVVESISIDSNSTTQSSVTSTANKPAMNRGFQQQDAKSSSTPASAEVSNSVGGGGATSGVPSASASYQLSPVSQSSSTGTTSGAPRPQRRGTASVSSDEVVTFISRSNYSVTKQKLKDPNFGKELEMNSIQVLDLYGNSYGAKKGNIIFLDQGDRFVRQK
ncbi:hypothetical protein [Bdellovibrio sp. BCCA]|uniref:hypothetical protein n=1 Tax=Bdellovibrio sp. BCCA TaxID=3136281 RepID=UPI0030F14A66